MIVNHASTLSKEYFKSYIQLIMNTKNCSLDKGREITMQRLFDMNKYSYGEETCENFKKAYKELKKVKK